MLFGDRLSGVMDKLFSVNHCLALLGLLLLHGAVSTESRSILNPGNHVIHTSDVTAAQNKILSLLLHKSLLPVERNDALGLELVSKLAELEELQALKDLELEWDLTSNTLSEETVPKKRAEPCFWKYCV